MRENGKLLGEILQKIAGLIKPGTATMTLEKMFIDFCEKHTLVPACKGYTAGGMLPPFPTGLCVYINSQGVHCFPKPGQIIKEGDLVTIDTVVFGRGIHVDAAFAKIAGNATDKKQKLVEAAKNALKESINVVKAGINVGLISHTMYQAVKLHGFNVLRDYAGHGIGQEMHETPDVPCIGDKNDGMKLIEGMTICIESLVCESNPKVDVVNSWETKMHDGGLFLQFERTILVTADGHEILTPFEV